MERKIIAILIIGFILVMWWEVTTVQNNLEKSMMKY